LSIFTHLHLLSGGDRREPHGLRNLSSLDEKKVGVN
jgi:hypothetical protein